ncbi:hypothetical protein CYLTODRAFT_413193 [Cylindrobasidium torrendii FP15055 ss-10]|uniref:Uncharacterized protein n=1 Tax=Cylindrobasidium torrendii FP15055 ss-10 TaxID=1314674 RepID=A0A0D7B388_9AGAR|nr:hypothetical protein CYLTODRAFT_413193 [Cylindrobasidium torrendii FP15055 ss-10]
MKDLAIDPSIFQDLLEWVPDFRPSLKSMVLEIESKSKAVHSGVMRTLSSLHESKARVEYTPQHLLALIENINEDHLDPTFELGNSSSSKGEKDATNDPQPSPSRAESGIDSSSSADPKAVDHPEAGWERGRYYLRARDRSTNDPPTATNDPPSTNNTPSDTNGPPESLSIVTVSGDGTRRHTTKRIPDGMFFLREKEAPPPKAAESISSVLPAGRAAIAATPFVSRLDTEESISASLPAQRDRLPFQCIPICGLEVKIPPKMNEPGRIDYFEAVVALANARPQVIQHAQLVFRLYPILDVYWEIIACGCYAVFHKYKRQDVPELLVSQSLLAGHYFSVNDYKNSDLQLAEKLLDKSGVTIKFIDHDTGNLTKAFENKWEKMINDANIQFAKFQLDQ